MQTVSNKSLSGIFLQCKLFFCDKIPNHYFLIQYLFKFSIAVFKMPLDSGRLVSIQ